MLEFEIELHSFRQVQSFVALCSEQPFDIRVGNERQRINGKDLMGIFSLDFSRPLQVFAQCTQEEFLRFRQKALALPPE